MESETKRFDSEVKVKEVPLEEKRKQLEEEINEYERLLNEWGPKFEGWKAEGYEGDDMDRAEKRLEDLKKLIEERRKEIEQL